MSFKYNYTYKTTNLIDGKFYYGCHQTNNLADEYIGSGTRLLRAINKHGIENFEVEWLENYDTKEEMFEAEKELITERLIENIDCYNIVPGGKGGSQKGHHNSKGCKHTEETKRKQSIRQSGRTKYNCESVNKMAKTLSGRTKETHKYLFESSNKKKGRTKYNHKGIFERSKKMEGRTKNNHNGPLLNSIMQSKGFYITPFGTFYSIRDASKHLGCSPQTISRACHFYNDRVFEKRNFCNAKGIFKLLEKEIGKTYKQIGFYFAKFTNKQQRFNLYNKLIQV